MGLHVMAAIINSFVFLEGYEQGPRKKFGDLVH